MNRRDEGSVFRSKDGKRWYARLRYTDADGKAREKKRTCPTQALARVAISNLRDEIVAETDIKNSRRSSGGTTYRELDAFYRREYVHAAKFVGGKRISGFRQDVRTVGRYLDRALEFFGDMPLDAITYDHCRRYKMLVESTPTPAGRSRSVSDTNHHLKRVRRLFKVAIEQGWLAVDPFARGGSLIIEAFEVERTRVLSHDEEARLIAGCERWRTHLVPVIILAVETGMRRGEIQQLRWRDIDLTARVITVVAANTKTLKPRNVPISSRLRSVLAQLRQNTLMPNSLVFGGGDFKRAFAGACKAAGLDDVHFHDLRHTAITRMIDKLPIPVVMRISGHTQMRTFMRYVNLSKQAMLDIAEQLDGHAETPLRRGLSSV